MARSRWNQKDYHNHDSLEIIRGFTEFYEEAASGMVPASRFQNKCRYSAAGYIE